MEHLLEIDSVQLSFGERTILNNIYIQSKTGRITGILGRNGCGKSCLLKLIFGEIKSNEKSVCINGAKLFEDDRDFEDMRMLPQFNFLPKHLKVIQAFKFFDIDFEAFSHLFPDFWGWKHFKIKHLSGGNIRIVETYLILKSKTKFSILDEPFSHLTPRNCEIFIDIMQQEKTNKGIIITDHLHRYITQASDDLYVIKDCVSYKIDDIADLEKYGYLRSQS